MTATTAKALITKRALGRFDRKPGRHGVKGAPGLKLHGRSIEQRYWTHRFRVAGRQTELSLGPYPAVTFDEALKKYHEQRAQVTSGVDPIADKHERRRKGSGTVSVGALTFAEDSLQTSVLQRRAHDLGRTAQVGAPVVAGPADKTASILAFARNLCRSLGACRVDGRSSKSSDRHCFSLSAEQLALNAQQHVARSRGRDGSEPWRAYDGDGRQKFGLFLRRQSDAGLVGFASESRQPSSAGSTTARFRSLCRRSRVVLSLARVTLAVSLGRIGLSRSNASTRSSAAFDCASTRSRSVPLLGGPDEPALVGFLSDPFISAARMALRVSSSSAESETYLCASSTKPIICPCASPRRLAEDVPH